MYDFTKDENENAKKKAKRRKQNEEETYQGPHGAERVAVVSRSGPPAVYIYVIRQPRGEQFKSLLPQTKRICGHGSGGVSRQNRPTAERQFRMQI